MNNYSNTNRMARELTKSRGKAIEKLLDPKWRATDGN